MTNWKNLLGLQPSSVASPPAQAPTGQVQQAPPWFPTPGSMRPDVGQVKAIDVASIEKYSARIFGRYASYQALAVPPTYTFMAFEWVPQGKIWEIIRVSVVQADPFTAVAGTTLLYVSTQVPQDSATEPSFPDMFVAPVAMPVLATVTRRQVMLQEKERVIACMKSLPANQQVLGSMLVIEYDRATFLSQLGP
jgi:hypothetical protein